MSSATPSAAPSSSSSTSQRVLLHPLVMMGMSDHYTREKLSGGVRAIGGFVGIQDGLKVSLLDTTEMKITPGMDIDLSLLKRKLELITKVFPKYEFLGWYLVGNALGETDMLLIQKQVQALNESPLVILMEGEISASRNSKKVLPISAYETVMQTRGDGTSVQSFVELDIQIETTDSERVIVDHVNSSAPQASSSSSSSSASLVEENTFAPHMATLKNAVQKLTERVLLIRAFLVYCSRAENQSSVDLALVREAIACVNVLPALDAQVLNLQYKDQLSDTLLVSLLANITKQTTAMSAILEKFFIAHPNPGDLEAGFGVSKPSLKRSGSTSGGGGSGGGGGRKA